MLFIFDMGGVVTNTATLEKMFQKLNLTADEFFRICKKESDIWEKAETGKIGAEEFWKLFNDFVQSKYPEKNIPVVEHDLFRLYFHPSKNLKTIELINNLKKKHRVVCGTNTIQSHWENHMERGDYSFFNQTYASNKIGAAKPDALFYKLILEAEGYKPEDAFFTDDKLENIKAAQSVGINAVQFTTAEDLIKEWGKYC